MSQSTKEGTIATLVAEIWRCLDGAIYPSAVFLCERLVALDPENKDWRHLMGLVYQRSGKYALAINATMYGSGHLQHLGCAYVYSQCCHQLGKYIDGITALEAVQSQWNYKQGSFKKSFVINLIDDS